jgi:hypothetical protein
MVPFIRPSLQILSQKDVEERKGLENVKMRQTGTREWHKKGAQHAMLRLIEVVKAKELLSTHI